jgi:hypothetical protein
MTSSYGIGVTFSATARRLIAFSVMKMETIAEFLFMHSGFLVRVELSQSIEEYDLGEKLNV